MLGLSECQVRRVGSKEVIISCSNLLELDKYNMCSIFSDLASDAGYVHSLLQAGIVRYHGNRMCVHVEQASRV